MSVPNETQYNFRDPYNLTAGISISMIGVFGIVSNSTVIYIFCNHKSERNSFNTICAAKALANLFVLTFVFGMIFMPTTFYGSTPWLPTLLAGSVIQVGNAFYACNENLTFLIAINRFCAIFFPLRYSSVFGMKPTIAMLFCLYVYRMALVSSELHVAFDLGVCWLFFSPKDLTWGIASDEKCNLYDNPVPLVVIIFLMTTTVNIATFMKIVCFYRKRSQTDQSLRIRERKNIRLFFQTVLQDALYIIDLTFTFELASKVDHRLWTFLSGTLIWESLHSFDGFVMVVFTERVAFLKACLPKISAPPSIAVAPANPRTRTLSQTSTIASAPSN